MAEYVARYSERVQDVPTTLHRLFKLIRELDERAVALQTTIDGKCKELLQSAASSRGRGGRELPASKRQKVDTSALTAEIDAGMQKVISLAEEKVRHMCAACSPATDTQHAGPASNSQHA
jgi:transposase